MRLFCVFFVLTWLFTVYGNEEICQFPEEGSNYIYDFEDPEELTITSDALGQRSAYYHQCLALVNVRKALTLANYDLEISEDSLRVTKALFRKGYAHENAVISAELGVKRAKLAVKIQETKVLQLEKNAHNTLLRYKSKLKEGKKVLSDAELLNMLENNFQNWDAQLETLDMQFDVAKDELEWQITMEKWVEDMVKRGYEPERKLELEKIDTARAREKMNAYGRSISLVQSYKRELKDFMKGLQGWVFGIQVL